MITPESMRGMFFVVKGQYRIRLSPSYVCGVTGETHYLGGYDPYREDTVEWYQLLNTLTWTTTSCGSDLDTVVRGVYNTIVRCGGDKKVFARRMKANECSVRSPIMVELYKHIHDTYGDFCDDLIARCEDEAYEYLKDQTPLNKVKRRLAPRKVLTHVLDTTHHEDITPRKDEGVRKKLTPVRKMVRKTV